MAKRSGSCKIAFAFAVVAHFLTGLSTLDDDVPFRGRRAFV